MDQEVEFRLLGPLEVLLRGEAVPIRGYRQRVVLAMLLLEFGRVVTTRRLIDAVWEDEPPTTARTQVQIAVSELRRRISGDRQQRLIATHPAGYSVQVADDSLDVARFRRLVARGRESARNRQLAPATADLRAGLQLWRGEACDGIDSRLVQAAAVRLNEERLAVTEECIGLELELGEHHVVIGELRELLAGYPFREKLYRHLMLALYRSGRQAEALAVYREAHALLVDQHGLDPGEELRALERAILDNDPSLDRRPALEHIVPQQLPAAAPDFVGREEALAQLQRDLVPGAGPDLSGQVRVVLITGPGGVGKTTLAVQAAHLVRDQFPDGQLFAHLRGNDTGPRRPDDVLAEFLRALGVPPAMLPGGLPELAALYRSRLANHRILVVADDAASAEQALPLVPGDPRCAILVTSRSALVGLHGAVRLDLDSFTPSASVALLARVIGEDRVRAEQWAAAALADACGHLPLALRIAAAKLSVRPHWRLRRMADRLQDERRRLDELTLGGVGVRASISMSYQGLEEPERRLLLLLGMLGSTDFAGWVSGPLLDLDSPAAEGVLDQLVEVGLVYADVGAGGEARYRLHDLIRIFCQEALASEIGAAERWAARRRLLRCWLFLVREAHRREHGGDFTVLRSGAEPWPLPEYMVDELMTDPIHWFQDERSNLIAAVNLAAQLGYADLCWELAMTSVTFFESRADREAWRETHETALAAVRRAGDRRGEAAMRYSRGSLAVVEFRFPEAEADLEAALAWFTQDGDRHGRGLALRHLAFIDRLQGRHDRAQERYAAALTDLRAVGDRVAEAHALGNLAQIHIDRGAVLEAERLLREALELCDGLPVRRLAAQLQHRLGQLFLAREDLWGAEAAFAGVLRTVTETSDPVGRAYALLGIGSVHVARRELEPAEAVLQDAMTTMRQTGHELGVGRALLALAEARLGRGDLAGAAAKLDEADAVLAKIGATVSRSQVEELRERLRGQ